VQKKEATGAGGKVITKSALKKKWTVPDYQFREVYCRDFSKWFAHRSSTYIFHLVNLFFGLSVKSAPSSRSFCSQNWVLDRRWKGYLRFVFIF
jgi:hypothetical protein